MLLIKNKFSAIIILIMVNYYDFIMIINIIKNVPSCFLLLLLLLNNMNYLWKFGEQKIYISIKIKIIKTLEINK